MVENPQVVPSSRIDDSFTKDRVKNYLETWKRAGIEMDPIQALRKIENFNPEVVFLLTNPDKTEVYAQIYTAFARVNSVREIGQKFPTYESIEKAAQKMIPSGPNLLICFSLNCPEGFRVLDRGVEMSLARAILTKLPTPKGVRKLAYSFMPNVSPETSLFEHYVKNLENTKTLGPTGMHEALGGIAIGMIEASRLEHRSAGGGNVLVLYPINATEEKLFAKLKVARRGSPENLSIITEGNATYFEDVQKVVEFMTTSFER